MNSRWAWNRIIARNRTNLVLKKDVFNLCQEYNDYVAQNANIFKLIHKYDTGQGRALGESKLQLLVSVNGFKREFLILLNYGEG
jgi:hypothetical protein